MKKNVKNKYKDKIIIKPNILVEPLNENTKIWRFWVVVFLFIYILSYPNFYNFIFIVLFCYMWWYYLIPDIINIACHYLSIKQNHPPIKRNGLFSYICNENWCNNYTNKSKNTLEKYGNIPIKSLTIYRTPIYNIIDKALNMITLGKWNFLKKKFDIDTFFHLSLIANIGYKHIVIEKNELINIYSDYDNNTFIGSEKIIIDMIEKQLTINQMLENTRMKIKNTKFFSYDAFENNCQMFIKHILKHNKLYNKKINVFLNQDITRLLSDFPYYAKKIINFSTNTFAIICDIIQKI
jgi:hypothetical protein